MTNQVSGVLGDRFSIERCLGKGGFGIVYQAFDRQRNIPVALKLLRHRDPAALYRLKQEFRALTDLSHPNLLSLYELLFDGEQWVITMELIDGTDFVSYVCDVPDAVRKAQDQTATVSPIESDVETGVPAAVPAQPHGPLPPRLDFPRLEAATRQLAEGLQYLHAAGKIHRDIKPSNVLVARSGRVVLLDFGLVAELAPALSQDELELSGTPAYMAPERALNGPLTEASDWYSVGVMLFEALTGRLPFSGSFLEVLQAKCERDAPAPRDLVPEIPDGLDRLCRDLLARAPEDRPSGAAVLARLGSARLEPWLAPDAPSRTGELFVGRGPELALLNDSFQKVAAGRPMTVLVHGPSGMGKSLLVRHFLEQLHESAPSAVVLTGRCYERESVPYKALDSLVDSLSRYLSDLPRAEVEAVLPANLAALARLFPALLRVDAIAQVREPGREIPDSQEFRRRGFAAFRALLARIGERQPLVLFIDDLQWGDADSAALLTDLLRPPDPPVLLLIACYRSEEAQTSVLLRRLLHSDTSTLPPIRTREVIVRQLAAADARELALALIGSRDSDASQRADEIVRESGGSPFFIDQLVRFAQSSGLPRTTDARSTDLTLESVIERRVSRLPLAARQLLEVLAVFGRAMEVPMASRVAEIGSEELVALAALRAARLARTRRSAGREEVDIYHDRIRETVAGRLSAATLQHHHERLAVVLEESSGADPETLALHFQGAGRPERAAIYAISAADRAAAALAFDRAAQLYRLALDLKGPNALEAREIHARLGDALAAAGRGHEAAGAYLWASTGALAAEQIELRRRAAEQLLQSGHIDDGFRVLRDVLATVGLKLAAGPRRALLSLLVQRLWIALRGLGFRERDRTQVSAEALVRVDACWSVATGLAIVDYIRAAEFQARHLLLALRIGEPYRIVRALAMELAYTSVRGPSRQPHNEKLIRVADQLTARVDQPEALALVTLVKGSVAYMQGQWVAARQLCEDAERLMRERCRGVAWQLDTAHFYTLLSLFYLGEVRELSRRLPTLLKEARERNALYAETNLRTRIAYIAWLAKDDADQARREVRQGIERWSQQGFHIQHYYELFASAEISLYSDDPGAAWELLDEKWRDVRRSFLLRVQPVLIESMHLRGRAALALAVVDTVDADRRLYLLRAAAKDARVIARQDAAWARPMAQLLEAGLATTQRRTRDAEQLLRSAEAGFAAVHMTLHASAARRRLGELVGGTDGDFLVRESDRSMGEQGIRHPARMTAALAPGAYVATPQPQRSA
jgi:serine/threonine protein kinase